jgi:hypothetical protein
MSNEFESFDRKSRRTTYIRWICIGILLIVALLGAWKAWRVWILARSLMDRMGELQALAGDEAQLDLGAASETLRGFDHDLRALHSEIGFAMPVVQALGWVPEVGPDLQAAPELMDMALSLSQAGTIAFDGLEPLNALLEGEAQAGSPLAQVLATIENARPQLQAAQSHLEEAIDHRKRIDSSTLSSRTAAWLDRFDRYLPSLQTALDGAGLVPDLLGSRGERTYLILIQNNDELRATGGFISAIGLLTLKDGEIAGITFEDSYSVDDFDHPYPDSPPPVLRYMGIDQWVFRDANWSPDFPTAAQKALELYRISRELDADGVLSVDQHALKAIVAALAPLEVESWPEPVTADNVISLIRLAWSPDETDDPGRFDIEWWRQRKQFVGDLFNALRAKVEGAPGEVDWMQIGRGIFEILDERHLQIWLADDTSTAMDLLSGRGWDGAIRQQASDFLLVIDTNMGFNKANARVEQRLNYRVVMDVQGASQATLTLNYRNTSASEGACNPRPHYGADYDALTNRCYWDYVRIYAPADTRLVKGTAHPVPAEATITKQAQSGAWELLPDEKGKAVFGSFFFLPKGEALQTRVVYDLPQATLEQTAGGWLYRLLVQKQAGTAAVPLRVTLTLPPGATVQSVVAPVQAKRPEPGTLSFDTNLEQDRSFEVVFGFEQQ